MKLNKKIILGTAVLAGILAIPSAFRNTETYSTGCETYQGYTDNRSDWERIYVFDEKALRERGIEPPNYVLFGSYDMAQKLKIGQSYRLEVKEGIAESFFPAPKVLVSFQPCTDSEQDTQKR